MIKKGLFLGLALLVFRLAGAAQYGTMSHREVKDLIKDTRSMASLFEKNLDKALDKSIIDDTNTEDRYNDRADDLEDQLNKAKSKVGDPDKLREHLDSAMQAAFDVEKLMEQHRFSEDVIRDWDLLRNNLNTLAALVGLQPITATTN